MSSDGILQAYKALLNSVTITGDGTFQGDITNPLFRVERGVVGDSYSFATPIKWSGIRAYDGMSSISSISTLMPYDISYSDATSVTATYKGVSVSRIGKK